MNATLKNKGSNLVSLASKSKLKTASALTLPLISLGMMFANPAYAADVDPNATPYGEVVVGGEATFARPADNLLNVNQGSDRVLINWDSFNIGRDATTQFYQPNANAIAVNRVVAAGSDPTQILGQLIANGRVMVLDRNGVMFGPNSRVDVGGIVASTGNLSDEDALNPELSLEDMRARLKDIQPGEISNEGMITVAEGGLAAFVAPTVSNSGTITAKLGKVELAGQAAETIDMYGDGLVEFEVTPAAKKAIVNNSGVIDAEGGVIAMTVTGADAVADSVINMSGVAKVSSVTMDGGNIVLGGGNATVNVSGTLDASGTKAGSIKVTGKDINVASTADLNAISTAAGAKGGKVEVIATDDLQFDGSIDVTSEQGEGGYIETSGLDTISISETTKIAGGEGGYWLVDPVNLTIDGTLWAPIINGALGAGMDFALTTNYAGADVGDLTINADLIWNSKADLFLGANNNLTVNGNIWSQYNAGAGTDGQISLYAYNNLTVNNGFAIMADNGNIGMQATTGDMNIGGGVGSGNAVVTTNDGTMLLIAGDDMNIGGQAGTTVVGSYYNNASFWVGDDININAGTGAGNVTNVGSLTGTTELAAYGDITISGNATNVANVIGNTVDISTTGTAVGSTGVINADANSIITASVLTGFAKAGASFLGANNVNILSDFAVTGPTGDFKLNDTNGLYVVGDVTTNNGDINIATTVGNLTVTGFGGDSTLIKSASGDVNLTGANVVVGSTSGANNATKIEAGDTILINGNDVVIESGTDTTSKTAIVAGNIFGTLANNNTTISAGAAGQTTIDAAIIGLNGDLDSSGAGNVIINDNAQIETSNNTYMKGANIQLNGGSITAAGVGLTSATTITQESDATMNAGMLAGSSNGNTTLNGTANVIGVLGDFATGTGSFKLNDTAANLDITGMVLSNGGEITINNSGSTNLSATGSLTSYNGSIILGGSSVNVAGDITTTFNLVLDAMVGAVTQAATSDLLVSNNLNVLAGTSADLTAGNNQIGSLKTVETHGNFSLKDANGGLWIVGDVDTNGGNVDIDTVGNLDVKANGTIDAKGGNIDIDQTGKFSSVNSDVIKTSGTGTINLWQRVGGSIQNAINAISNSGTGESTLELGAGTYAQTVDVNRRITLQGAGSGVGGTIIDGTTLGDVTALVTVSGNGTDDTHRVIVKDIAVKNAKAASAGNNAGSGVMFTGGTTANFITLNNVVSTNNAGHGLAFNFSGTSNGVDITNSTFSDNKGSGVRVATSVSGLNDLTVTGGEMSNNRLSGLAINPSGTTGNTISNVTIDGTTFSNNDTSNGFNGDLLILNATGDVTIKNVDITSTSGAYWSAWIDWQSAAGSLTFDNVAFNGTPGNRSLYLTGTNGAGISFNDVVFDATNSGMDLKIDGSTFGNIDLGNTSFSGKSAQDILLGSGGVFVDATDSSFLVGGIALDKSVLANNFAIEDRVKHDLDIATLGHVKWNSNNDVYVTQNSGSIQRGIDAAEARETVHVDGGTYNEHLTINKALKLSGNGTTLQAVNNTALVTVTADDVNIDPMTFDGMNISNRGVDASAADNLQVLGNTYLNFTEDAIHVEGSNNIEIKGNIIHNVGNDGIDVRGGTSHLIEGNVIGYTDGAGTVSGGANNIGKGANGGDGIYLSGSDNLIGDKTIIAGNIIGNMRYNQPTNKGSGILVSDSSYVVIGQDNNGNVVKDAGSDGIVVLSEGGISHNIRIEDNFIDGTERTGMYFHNANNLDVVGNRIYNTGRYAAIYGYQGFDHRIVGNQIDHNDEVGIYLQNVNTSIPGFSEIKGNWIDNTGENKKNSDGLNSGDGIRVTGTNVWITENEVGTHGGNVRGDGIAIAGGVTPGAGVVIRTNIVANTTNQGIHAYNTNNVSIGGSGALDGNHVSLTGGDGIRVADTNSVVIARNDIDDTGNNGITVSGGSNVTVGGDADTDGNLIDNTKRDGIYVGNTTGTVKVKYNKIKGAGTAIDDDGIQIYNVDNAIVDHNRIENAWWDGINVMDSDGVDLTWNTIIGTKTASGIGLHTGNSNIDIKNNNISNSKQYGIYANVGTGNLVIDTNTIRGVTDHDGIFVTGNAGAAVTNNTIDIINGGVAYGINVVSSAGAKVNGNFIGVGADHAFNTGDDSGIHGAGILVNASANSEVKGNRIAHTDADGIAILNSGGTSVSGDNRLNDIGVHGISVSGGASAVTVDGNTIFGSDTTSGADGKKGAGQDGIHVENNDGVQITNNWVKGGNNGGHNGRVGGAGASQNGIYVTGSDSADITGNHIVAGNGGSTSGSNTRKGGVGAVGYGILAENNVGVGNSDGVNISNNEIKSTASGNANSSVRGAGLDGIRVVNSGHTGAGAAAKVFDNDIIRGNSQGNSVGGAGISIDDTDGIEVAKNTVSRVVNEGIVVTGSDNVVIGSTVVADGNTVTNSGKEGIKVTGGVSADILNNIVTTAGANGIHVDGNNEVAVNGNKVTDTVGDGIYVTGSDDAVIGGATLLEGNVIKEADGNGIHLNGGEDGTIQNNTIQGGDTLVAGAKLDGIHVQSNEDVQVRNNHILGGAGIDIGIGSVAGGNGANGHGIAVYDSADAQITGNEIKGADGFTVDFVIPWINVHVHFDVPGSLGAGQDGIHVATSNGSDVDNNNIKFVGANGISLIDSSNVTADINTISNTGGHGMFADPAFNVSMTGNTISNTVLDGLHAEDIVLLNIADNTITTAGQDGIGVERSALVNVSGNTVTGSVTGHGISLFQTAGSLVSDNDVTGTLVGNGIDVTDSTLAAVAFNRVFGSIVGDGIHADDVQGLAILGNISALNMDDAINVANSDDVLIALNIAGGSITGHGVEITDTTDAVVALNLLGLTAGDGIHAERTDNLDVRWNLIALTNGDGVELIDSSDAEVRENLIFGATEDGIAVSGAGSTQANIDNNLIYDTNRGIVVNGGATGADITDNTINGTTAEGILSVGNQDKINGNTIDDAGAFAINASSDTVGGLEINDNIISNTKGGIKATGVDNVDIQRNELDDIIGNGIVVDGGVSAEVLLNQLHNIMGAIGIEVDDNVGAQVNKNTLTNDIGVSTGVGIDVDQSNGTLIDENTVDTGSIAAIRASNSTGITISDNTVTDTDASDDADDYGIQLVDSTGSFITGNSTVTGRSIGIFVDPSDNIYVGFNTAFGNGIGINFLDTTNSTLENNIVYSNKTGIQLAGLTDNITIHNNTVGQLAQGNGVGVALVGNTIGEVALTDNVFTHNGTGLYVESGTVDLTGVANPNTFIAEDGQVNYGIVFAPDVGLDPNGDNTHLVSDTFGSTVFQNFDQADGDFYIRLEDGAFFYGGTPFLLDATQVSFNGITAGGAKFGIGSLTPAQLLAIEAMLYDVDDDLPGFEGRGQIFQVDLGEEDPDDLNAFRGAPGNFALTILALPNVPGGTPNLGAVLNNLVPFAGGNRPANIPAGASANDLAGINPAAGGDDAATPAQLNATDPASGGTNANCWSDVASSVGAGSVNFNFNSGDMGALVAAEAACGVTASAQ